MGAVFVRYIIALLCIVAGERRSAVTHRHQRRSAPGAVLGSVEALGPERMRHRQNMPDRRSFRATTQTAREAVPADRTGNRDDDNIVLGGRLLGIRAAKALETSGISSPSTSKSVPSPPPPRVHALRVGAVPCHASQRGGGSPRIQLSIFSSEEPPASPSPSPASEGTGRSAWQPRPCVSCRC